MMPAARKEYASPALCFFGWFSVFAAVLFCCTVL